MKKNGKPLMMVSLLAIATFFTFDAQAVTRRARAIKASPGLAAVCPKIQSLNPSAMFWKNNKPHRASSAINAPVIGYFKQMTLAYNAGKHGGLGTVLYDSKGGRITSMVPYSCRADHCGGRVVSTMQTDAARRLAISRTKSPRGYISVGRGVCVEIPDIGRCYGTVVDKSRALCNTTVG